MKRTPKLCITMIILALVGCAGSLEAGVRKTYPGPDRPLEEVAVVVTKNAAIIRLDGRCVYGKVLPLFFVIDTGQCLNTGGSYGEVDLLPGEHEVSYRYAFGSYTSNEASRRYLFEAGKVYRIIGTAADDRTVEFKIVCEGTVEEMAPIFATEKRPFPYKAPSRWGELAAKTEARGTKAATVAEKPLPIAKEPIKDELREKLKTAEDTLVGAYKIGYQGKSCEELSQWMRQHVMVKEGLKDFAEAVSRLCQMGKDDKAKGIDRTEQIIRTVRESREQGVVAASALKTTQHATEKPEERFAPVTIKGRTYEKVLKAYMDSSKGGNVKASFALETDETSLSPLCQYK